MGFVKVDDEFLHSSLWEDRDARTLFFTCLLMARPRELTADEPAIMVKSLNSAGWTVPAGWYGFVPSSGAGIIRADGIDPKKGWDALERLCMPDPDSRSAAFAGRRMARVNGGYAILNYMTYRDKDFGATERMRLLRERRRNTGTVTANNECVTANSDVRHKTEGIRQKGRILNTQDLIEDGIEEQTARDWLAVRSAKRAPLTKTAWDAIKREASRAGITPQQAVKVAAENGWQGFKASWLANQWQSRGKSNVVSDKNDAAVKAVRERYQNK